jgi:hypothetical protein
MVKTLFKPDTSIKAELDYEDYYTKNEKTCQPVKFIANKKRTSGMGVCMPRFLASAEGKYS